MSYHSIIEAERDLAALIERAAAGKRLSSVAKADPLSP
jgi:hypothetical protein